MTPTNGPAPPPPGRHETPQERADRLWTEMLQEVRVCQTGAQILFGFLIGVAFTDRFTELPDFDQHLYIAAVALGAISTGALIAPVAFRRFLAGHGMKPELIRVASRLIAVGLVSLALTITASLLLLLRTATDNAPLAWIVSAVVLLWFAAAWLVLPLIVLRRTTARRDRPGQRAPDPGVRFRHDHRGT